MGRNGWKFCSAVALGLVVFFSGPSVMAQDDATTSTGRMGRGGRGERGGMGGGSLRAALEVSGLTEEQKAKIEKIQTESREKFQAQRQKAGSEGGAPGARGGFGGPEMRKIMEETQAQVEAVLTEEQKKEYKSKIEAQRARWGSRNTSGTAAADGEKK